MSTMASSLERRIERAREAKDAAKTRDLDDSQGTAPTVASDDGGADRQDKPPPASTTPPAVVIHEDAAVRFKSLTRVASNLADLVLESPHQADVAGGTDAAAPVAGEGGEGRDPAPAYHDDMVTIHEEGPSAEAGAGDAPPRGPAKSPRKGKIRWGTVVVRDYPMILGDNPCCSCGPPVCLDWEYQEYPPLAVDDYEGHRPPRRTFRELARNYYQRKHLLSFAGFTEAEFKRAQREVDRIKFSRHLVRSLATAYPAVLRAAEAAESAGRKLKRLVREDHWKAEKFLYAAL